MGGAGGAGGALAFKTQLPSDSPLLFAIWLIVGELCLETQGSGPPHPSVKSSSSGWQGSHGNSSDITKAGGGQLEGGVG